MLHDPPSQPPPPEPDANGPQLRPADGRAIDQAMQLRFQSLGLHCDDERTRRASDLLALVGAPEISSVAGDALQAQARALRIERVMARLSSFPASTEESPAERQAEIVACSEALHPADDDALWALATAGFDAARVPASLRQRARAHMQLLELAVGPSPNVQRAGLSPVESTQARIQDTLALIDDHDQQRALDTAGSVLHDARTQRAGIRRFRWADVVGIAAMLLVAGSIAIPTLQHVRREAQRFACENNLSSAATAFASYAADHADALPIATAGFGAKPWWNVGDPQGTSNSANLYLLVHQGYIPIDRLACPGNADARRVLPQSQPSLGQPAHDWLADQEVSYSYRLGVSARDALAAGAGAGSVILADRSPIATKNRRGLPAFADENSENHAGRGQMVLMADGSVRWLKTPMLPIDGVSQDNIWLPRQVELLIDRMRASKAMGGTVRLLNGREMPAGPADAFVGP